MTTNNSNTQNRAARIDSDSYRRKVKQLISQVKELRGIHSIRNVGARPKKDATKQAAYDKAVATFPDKNCVHFWCQPYTVDESRRVARSDSERTVQAIDALPTDSVKY